MITRGRTVPAQRRTIQARPLICLSTGFPPLALEKCLQSGDAHSRPTGLPAQTAVLKPLLARR